MDLVIGKLGSRYSFDEAIGDGSRDGVSCSNGGSKYLEFFIAMELSETIVDCGLVSLGFLGH